MHKLKKFIDFKSVESERDGLYLSLDFVLDLFCLQQQHMWILKSIEDFEFIISDP